MRKHRIAIIGAGPAGLTAAIAARELGLEVTVFEQAPDFRRIGGGVMLQSNGLRVLECLGLLDSFRPSMRLTRQIQVEASGGQHLLTADLNQLDIPQNHSAIVLRYALQEHLLAEALQRGVPVQFDHRLTGVSCEKGAAVLRFSEHQEQEADVVVACDGAHSKVREALALPARRRMLGLAAIRGVVPIRTTSDTIREIWCRDGRMFGIGPLPGDRTYFFCTLPPAQWPTILSSGISDWVAGWESAGPDAMTLLRAVPDWSAVNYAELEEVKLERWYRPPVFMVGDAAHAMAPNLGQGANCAMVDALVLMRLLARTLDSGSSLENVGWEYDALRRPFVTRIQNTAWQLGAISRVTSVPARLARGAMLWVSRQSRWLNRRAMGVSAGYSPAEEPFFDRLASRQLC